MEHLSFLAIQTFTEKIMIVVETRIFYPIPWANQSIFEKIEPVPDDITTQMLENVKTDRYFVELVDFPLFP